MIKIGPMNLARTLRELRKEHRFRTLRSGRVFFSNNRDAKDCNIRNLSRGGAKLEFKRPFDGPDELTLQIGIGEMVQSRVPCEVMWRQANEVGVRFTRRQSFILYSQGVAD